MIRFDVQFSLDGLAENVAVTADLVQRKAALDLFGELIQVTPVDTGRARAGWSMDIRHGGNAPEDRKKPKGWKNGDTPLYQRPSTPMPPKGAPFIMIYNNVEYIVYLNEGRSTQAPTHFVEQAVDKISRNLK